LNRLFPRHKQRRIFSLDGLWKFKTDPEALGLNEKWYELFPKDACDIVVPSCWNNELGLYDYEGIAWYSTTFTNIKKYINLVFHAVTGQAEVYMDGQHLGGHYGGFTGFEFFVGDLPLGEHSLVIQVDNTHNLNTIPLSRVDWFHYGGITRSVEVMELEAVWIKSGRIDYVLDETLTNAVISASLKLNGSLHRAEMMNVNLYVDQKLIISKAINADSKGNLKIDEIELKDIKLWDIGKPNLYTIRFEIQNLDGCVIDDLAERVGFRLIKVHGAKLMLNNKEVYIKGVNRHEDHPDWGFALPFKLMKKDMDIIKDMGCNFIRGSHYPNSEMFLDYCDQEGMLFLEEIPMWGFFEEDLNNPIILERGLMMHEEMVKRDLHHPCIIIWSLHNEIETSTQIAYDMTKAFAEKVRSLDNTRPLTYASMYTLEDICYSLVDIVCINKYFGWYYDKMEAWEDHLKQIREKLQKENLSHMPMLISEFGAAAIYGDSTFEGPKWTENYQEKYLNYTLKLFSREPGVIGSCIWQYCDIRTSKELEMGRARSFNNKGILNEYRKPKLAYWTVKKIYNEIV
jgi:beta-glucuronidase